jgi:hypothetical protein
VASFSAETSGAKSGTIAVSSRRFLVFMAFFRYSFSAGSHVDLQ